MRLLEPLLKSSRLLSQRARRSASAATLASGGAYVCWGLVVEHDVSLLSPRRTLLWAFRKLMPLCNGDRKLMPLCNGDWTALCDELQGFLVCDHASGA
jgi:hypothetical protein